MTPPPNAMAFDDNALAPVLPDAGAPRMMIEPVSSSGRPAVDFPTATFRTHLQAADLMRSTMDVDKFLGRESSGAGFVTADDKQRILQRDTPITKPPVNVPGLTDVHAVNTAELLYGSSDLAPTGGNCSYETPIVPMKMVEMDESMDDNVVLECDGGQVPHHDQLHLQATQLFAATVDLKGLAAPPLSGPARKEHKDGVKAPSAAGDASCQMM